MAMAMAPSAARGVSFPARRPAPSARTRAASAAGAGGDGTKWWAPLLGWSAGADYLSSAPAPVVAQQDDAAAAVRRRFVGALTEEKARELRARTAGTESFHDAMYHSAIASRLASAD